MMLHCVLIQKVLGDAAQRGLVALFVSQIALTEFLSFFVCFQFRCQVNAVISVHKALCTKVLGGDLI